MLSKITNILSRHHQRTYSYTPNAAPPYDFETQRIWLLDVPVFPNANNIIQFVQVEFSDGSTDTAQVLLHPTDSCKSIIRTLTAPTRVIQKVYGMPVLSGNEQDFIQFYSATTTFFPFLFILDSIKSTNIDYNIHHRLSFTVLLTGFIDATQSKEQISQWNSFAHQYLPQMFANVFVDITNISEYNRVKIENKTAEIYVLAIDCETTHSQRYL